MKTYFKHQLKTNARAIIILTVLSMLICFFVAFDSMDRERSRKFVFDGEKYYSAVNHDGNGNPIGYYSDDFSYMNGMKTITDEKIIEVTYRDLTLSTSMTMLIILSIAVPVWMFAFLKKKRNLDCAYSLPISRRAMGAVDSDASSCG